MDLVFWNGLLFILKWVFIGGVYFVLLGVLAAVRREMSLRVETATQTPEVSPGRLRVLRPGNAGVPLGKEVPLKLETSVGARPDNDVILKDPYISGHHARLRWDGAAWWVTDLGSKNGTYINGTAIPPMQPQQAPTGGSIQFGDVAFELLD